MSLSNVFLEVFRKKEMQGQDFLRTTFLHRAVMALILSLVLLAHWHLTGVPVILPRLLSADVFPFLFAQRRYFAYLAADSILIVLIVALYNRAVQIAPLSTTIPFLSFTPVFLLGTGYVILGELPTLSQGEGVLFIVLGSLLMHRRSYRQGFFAPFHALFANAQADT